MMSERTIAALILIGLSLFGLFLLAYDHQNAEQELRQEQYEICRYAATDRYDAGERIGERLYESVEDCLGQFGDN